MQPVAVETAVNDVVGELWVGQFGSVEDRVEGREVDSFLQRFADIDDRLLDVARRGNKALRGSRNTVERLRSAIAAGEDAPVVAQHAVLARAAGDPVVAVAADQVVVLAFTEKDIVANHTVDEVITRFAVDLIGSADIIGRGRIVVLPTRCVVQKLGRPRDDLQCCVVIVVEGEERTPVCSVYSNEAVDVAVVAEDHVGVASVPVGGRVAVVVACRIGPCATEDRVLAVGPQRTIPHLI